MALRKKQAPVHSPCILSALVSQHVCERLFVSTPEASGAARRVLKAKALVETGVVSGKKGGLLMLVTGSAFMLLLLLRRSIPFSKRRFCAEIPLSTVAVCFPSLSLDAGMSCGCRFSSRKKKKNAHKKNPSSVVIDIPTDHDAAGSSLSVRTQWSGGGGPASSRGWRILALGPQVITRASVTAFADLDKSGQGHQIQRRVQFWLNFAQRLISG